ncbi:MAG: hypothetical protein ACLP5V_03065 [Candidatus Bathyarchaeia archaeon]
MSNPDSKKPAEALIRTITDLQDFLAKSNLEQEAWYRKFMSQFDLLDKKEAEVKQNLESAQRSMSAIYDEFIFEHKPYGTEFSEYIKRAYYAVHLHRAPNRIVEWGLKEEQRSLVPYQYDILAGVYLLQDTPKGANSNTLDGLVDGKDKGQIKRAAEIFAKKGYLKVQARRRRYPGVRPTNFRLTNMGRALLLDPQRSPSTWDPNAHRALEETRFEKAIRLLPYPQVYMSSRTTDTILRDICRCDAIVRDRKDKDSFGEEVRAINVETDVNVRECGSSQPDKEGAVYVSMVTPFIFGANRLEIVCEEITLPELEKLWDALPKWLNSRIVLNPLL